MRAESIPPGVDVATLVPPAYLYEGRATCWDDWRNVAHLVLNMTRRHLADRYRGSALGFLWSFFHPILMMATYTFVFRFVFRQTIPGVPYPAFFLAGYMVWQFFYVSMTNAAASVVDGSYLINKTYFPRIALPLSAILSNTVNYLAGVPVLIGFAWALGLPPGWNLLFFPLALALALSVALGLGLLVAGLAPFFRDVIQLLEVVANVWFFATPILYPLEFPARSLGPELMTLYRLNPMVGVVRCFHSVFLGLPFPTEEAAISLVIGGALLWLGVRSFLKAAPHFTEAD